MKYSESLKKNKDFKEVYKNGRSAANRSLVLYVKENDLGRNRVGISVSKKVGNSVVRHRITRLIREGYRLQEEYFHIGYDMVFIARVNAKDCAYREIESAIYHLAKIHHIVEEKQ
jgi:ribonuclease P protein component